MNQHEDVTAKINGLEEKIKLLEDEALKIVDVCMFIEEYGCCDEKKQFCPKTCPKWEWI